MGPSAVKSGTPQQRRKRIRSAYDVGNALEAASYGHSATGFRQRSAACGMAGGATWTEWGWRTVGRGSTKICVREVAQTWAWDGVTKLRASEMARVD